MSFESTTRRSFLRNSVAAAAASTWGGLLARGALGAEPPKDQWRWLDNGVFRLGVNLSGGASIGHFSHSPQSGQADTRNVLNHYDRGRFVQQSYYGDSDGSEWNKKPWRYNPVQGGEWRGQSARVDEEKMIGKTFYARITPRNWGGGELLPECSMEQWISLQPTHAHLRFAFSYTGTKTHAPRHQEIPAMFVRADLQQMAWYEGESPWTKAPLQRRVPGWPNESAKLSENWVAYTGAEEKGVGLCVPVAKEATCYRFQAPGDAACSYVAPLATFALKPDLKWEYEAFLMLGAPDEMRHVFSGLLKRA